MAPVLQIRDLHVQRETGWSVALPALTLANGQVATLFGPSGCGKSTLLRAVVALPDAAPVTVASQIVGGRAWPEVPPMARQQWRRQALAFLPQGGSAALDPLARIDQQVGDATGASPAAAQAALTELGCAEPSRWLRAYGHQLSGGEAQRVWFAMAMLRRPQLLIADEPTANLDADSRSRLVAACRELLAGGTALLLASHDRALAGELGGDVLVAVDGRFEVGEPIASPWPAHVRPAAGVVVLAARGLTFRWGGRTLFASLDLTLRGGETLAVLGASGIGKTTLARVLAGQLQPAAGTVQRPAAPAAVQLVAQDAWSSLTPGRSVRSLCAEAPGPNASSARLCELAAALELAPALLERSREQLSGGEAQRIALLRALYREPAVLLLDEPTKGLDRVRAMAMLDLVRAEQFRTGLAVLLITHDQALAHAVAHRHLHLER